MDYSELVRKLGDYENHGDHFKILVDDLEKLLGHYTWAASIGKVATSGQCCIEIAGQKAELCFKVVSDPASQRLLASINLQAKGEILRSYAWNVETGEVYLDSGGSLKLSNQVDLKTWAADLLAKLVSFEPEQEA